MKLLRMMLVALTLNLWATSVYSADFVAGQILISFDDPPNNIEVAELVESFGLSILEDYSNLTSTPFYLISVPCEQENNWVNIFSNMKNIKYAELNLLSTLGTNAATLEGPKYLYQCKIFPHEVTFDKVASQLTIPNVVIDGRHRYAVVLEPPFNILDIHEKETCEFNDMGQLTSCLTNK